VDWIKKLIATAPVLLHVASRGLAVLGNGVTSALLKIGMDPPLLFGEWKAFVACRAASHCWIGMGVS
jgi:hypothetical protein